ncbi:Predicted arabinose efflux permease, MFS family [Amycolatopsis xylanica]|uniref:Predicted arabinose efflux permease, MFS family n=1 Tax=Amycolatopsis xylanica TaxID=589385 RepID=A0A1H3G3F1_9PSEU|nr:MFS transporter [Amycolatopsis xylanica]SDX97640.1 Predicted arabinose efflux permease, MFS family [Amycolatopsis xylanica]
MTDVSRVIRLYKTFSLFNGLLWWLPIFYLYQRQVGLSDGEIFGIQSIYYVAFLLLDIPASVLADRFDYRKFLVAGAGTLLLANLAPVLWPSYFGFLSHFLLTAVAYSLTSGAGSAYLYEYLHRRGADDRYRQAEGGARAYSLVGRIVCLPAAGLLMQWYMPSPYLLSALSVGVAAVVAMRLPPLPGDQPHEKAEKWGSLGPSWVLLRKSRMLILLMVQGVAVFTLVRILQSNLFQPILDSKQLPVAAFGLVMAGTTVFEALGAARPSWPRRYLGDIRAIFALTLIMGGCLALVVPAGLAATIACLCVFSFSSGLAFPIQRQLINNAITDPRCRATLLSLESLIDRAVCALVILALGSYLSAGKMNEFLILVAIGTAVLMGALVSLIYLVKRQQRVPSLKGT